MAKLPEPVDSAQIWVSPVDQFEMDAVTDTLWVGQVQFPESLPNPLPVGLALQKDSGTFYKAFDLDAVAKNPYLTENQRSLSSLGVTPNGISDSVSMNFKSISTRYSDTNLLDTPFGKVTGNLTAKGVKTIAVRARFKSGDKSDFTEGITRDENLNITIGGRVANTEVKANIQESSVKLDDANHNSLELKNDSGELDFGEYQVGLNAGEFSSFSKRLNGVKGVAHIGDYHVTAMMSDSKGTSAHDKIYGQNAQGPYSVSQRPIIVNSEQVRYNGQVLRRDTDYSVDYELGQITFKTQFIPVDDLFTVDYEYSDTVFRRNFVAFRTEYSPTSNANHWGATYLGLSESGDSPTAGISPRSHSQFGVDTRWQVVPGISLASESAVSDHSGRRGFAIKQGLMAESPSFNFSGSVKKISASFEPVGNPAIFPGQWGTEASAEWKPATAITIKGDQSFNQYPKNGTMVQNQLISTSEKWGFATYSFLTRHDRDMSVSGNYFDKRLTRNRVGVTSTWGWIEWSPAYQVERSTDAVNPSANATRSAVQLYSRLMGFDQFQLASEVEIQHQQRDLLGDNDRKSYGINAQIEPFSNATFEGSTKVVDDQSDGVSALGTIGYSLKPSKEWRFTGTYNLETLLQPFDSGTYRIMNHQANIGFGYTPIPGISLSYRSKPSFSEIKPLHNLRYDDRWVQQYGVDLDLIENWSWQSELKTTTRTALDVHLIPNAIPQLVTSENVWVVQNHYQLDSKTQIVQTFEKNTVRSETKQILATANVTDFSGQSSDKHEIKLTSQVHPKLKLGVGARLDDLVYTSTFSPSANQNQDTESLETEAEWLTTDQLTTKLSTSASKTNYRLGNLPTTYFATPRIEFRYQPNSEWLFSSLFEFTYSWAGQPIRRKKASLAVKYDTPIQNVLNSSITAQVDYENESAPKVYDTWDSLLKMTLIF